MCREALSTTTCDILSTLLWFMPLLYVVSRCWREETGGDQSKFLHTLLLYRAWRWDRDCFSGATADMKGVSTVHTLLAYIIIC